MLREVNGQETSKEIIDFTAPYMRRSTRIALISFVGTLAVYFASLWFALESASIWVTGLLVILNAFAAVRLYVIQHDLGHLSHFKTRKGNEIAGYISSTFTLTPFKAMQYNHNVHHAFVGDLDFRESTEIFTMTLQEWEAAGFWQRLHYRLYRNPLIMLPIGGVWTFALKYRWPSNALKVGAKGVILHDIGVLAWWFAIFWFYGWAGLAVYGATVLVSGCIGVFLVYLQHNFEDTVWDHKPDLDYVQATLQGSSALDLGLLWDLGTGSIAYHDIHHFNPRIPLYNLRKCHRELRKVVDIRTIGWPEAIRSFRLKLWDEETRRLVPFPRKSLEAAPVQTA